MPQILRAAIAEYIGTFALCFFGCGAIVMTYGDGAAGSLVTVAMAHALALIVFVTAFLYISGSQFNPAVSVGVFVAGKQSFQSMMVNIVAQCLGGASGVGAMVLAFSKDEALNTAMQAVNHGATLGALSTGDRANIPAVFILEALMTFALMFVIFAVLVDNRAHKLGGFGVGLTVGAGILAFGPVTGASMNPARSLGPALYGHWDIHWVYWVAPITGAVVAALVYKACFEAKPSGNDETS